MLDLVIRRVRAAYLACLACGRIISINSRLHETAWLRITWAGCLRLGLGVLEDVRLLLESTLRLDGQLGGHVCESWSRSQERLVEFGVCVVVEVGVRVSRDNGSQSKIGGV